MLKQVSIYAENKKGCFQAITGLLGENGINILDISQTIVSGYFNMMMIVDMKDSKAHFADMSDALDAIGAEMGVAVKCQKEEIFEMMHRV